MLTPRDFPSNMIGYRFYIPDNVELSKPFTNQSDRRLISIMKRYNSDIKLTLEIRHKRGNRMRAVIVKAHDKKSLEGCLRRFDECFPMLYACSNLQTASSHLKMTDLRRYYTSEDLGIDSTLTMITYYKLEFHIETGKMEIYRRWRQSPAASIIRQLRCMLVVAMKDARGTGFLRRYAIVSGENRSHVIKCYEKLRMAIVDLPDINATK